MESQLALRCKDKPIHVCNVNHYKRHLLNSHYFSKQISTKIHRHPLITYQNLLTFHDQLDTILSYHASLLDVNFEIYYSHNLLHPMLKIEQVKVAYNVHKIGDSSIWLAFEVLIQLLNYEDIKLS